MMYSRPVALTSLLLLFLVRTAWSFARYRLAARQHPSSWLVLSPAGLLSNLLPKISYISAGGSWFVHEKFRDFAKAGGSYRFSTYAFPTPGCDLLLADAALIKEVTHNRALFPKPVEAYFLLNTFGRNIVASEGDQWKKFRRVSAPAFSERNNQMVWDEALRLLVELFEENWAGKNEVVADNFVDISLAITLYTIAGAGFGKRLTWEDEHTLSPDHQMPFKDALRVCLAEPIINAVVPRWAACFNKRFKRAHHAYDELKAYMKEMISERQNVEMMQSNDLLSNLLSSNDKDSQLSDEDLMGNIYVFLLAGHETTAHTMAFALALLALYPDKQDKLLEQIRKILPDDRLPTYEEIPQFTYAMAVFYETLRMFPSASYVPKVAAENTTLRTTNEDGENIVLPVQKGMHVGILLPALHYNPRYWPDPHTFKPERFLEDWPRDAFVAFSAGPRACIGRKIAETEAIAVLTMFVARYKVTIKEEPQFVNEMFEQRKERILKASFFLSLVPGRIPLVFTRRD